MWLLAAAGSALFAGLTAVLAKVGIRDVDSNLATALRTAVVLVFSWLMVMISGAWRGLPEITYGSMVFLVLSGLVTGASWLCYFHALKIGDINKVAPVDKSSTVLTMILAYVVLGEKASPAGIFGACIIALGTYMMIDIKKGVKEKKGGAWFLFAFLSAAFAALSAIFAKVGVEDVNSNLATAIRTGVVLVLAWIIVFMGGKHKEISKIDKKSAVFLVLSGIATGASWLCYYYALKEGPASVVVPIDKLSILVTVLFSYIFFKEKLSTKAFLGLMLLTGGTLMLLL